jgi:hypothetical protein
MNKKSIGSGTRSKAAFRRSQEPPLSRTRRLGPQNERFYSFCSRSHPGRGFVGWFTKTKDCMISASKANPIEDSSAGSPNIAKQYVFLYASRQRQSKPTAKPKASLQPKPISSKTFGWLAKTKDLMLFYAFCSRSHAYRGLVGCNTCLCTQIHASRTTQPRNLKPFQKASQSI